MEYPTELNGVDIAGVYVHEPGCFLSNVAICIVSFMLFFYVGKPKNNFESNWKKFGLFIGLAAVGGLFTHGFPTYLGESLFFYAWAVKNSFVPIANYFASADVFPKKRWIKIFIITKAVGVIVLIFLTGKFLPVVVDLGITYFGVIYFSNKLIPINSTYRYIRNSFLIGLLSGPLYIFKYDLHELWFTHKDKAHVFIVISLLLIFLGLRKKQPGSMEVETVKH